jgi:predicted enzyme related to lactoylglutathione lyase
MLKFSGVSVYVDDVPAVLQFYRRAFGFETRFYNPDEALQYGELETGGMTLGIGSHQLGARLLPCYHRTDPSGRSFGFEIAFVTPDVPAAFARAVAAGAVVVAEPKAMPWGGTLAFVRSIEGTLVVLCTPVGK